MKKVFALLLCTAMLVSLCACGSRRDGYKLIDVPKELGLDVPALSEDAENLMEINDKTPLITAIPEKDLYLYCTDASIKAGVLVKCDGKIQYFPWIFTPQIAQPEVYVSDYNGDGLEDIAFTYCDTASSIKHNENLHILLANEKGWTDLVDTWITAATDARNGIMVSQGKDGGFTVSLLGKAQPFSLNATGKGELLGVFTEDYQDFTLGDTISVTVKPGLVFEKQSLPEYDVLEYTASIVCPDGALKMTDAKIVVL